MRDRDLSFDPTYRRSLGRHQYVTRFSDEGFEETFGSRYLFGEIVCGGGAFCRHDGRVHLDYTGDGATDASCGLRRAHAHAQDERLAGPLS